MPSTKREYFHFKASVELGGANVEAYINLMKGQRNGDKTLAQLKHSEKRPQATRYRVFIVSVQNTGWFSGSVRPMINSGNTIQHWPGLASDIKADRRWVVGVVNGDAKRPLATADLANAVMYFDCPGDRITAPNSHNIGCATPRQFEAIQELGETTFNTERIETIVQEMWHAWGTYNYKLWNSQHFALRLAFLLLDGPSRNQSAGTIRNMHRRLWDMLHEAFNWSGVQTHLGCMGRMIILSAATGGIGAGAVWLCTMANIFSTGCGPHDAMTKAMRFDTSFPHGGTLHSLGEAFRWQLGCHN